jgi:hypothetical protein
MQTKESIRVRLAVAQTGVGEVAAGEEAIASRRADQPAHVVVGEGVSSRRIVHLLDFSHQVVDVIDRRGVRISLRREAVQRVVQVGDGLALAVGLLGEVVVGVVLVIFAERGREIGLRDAAKGVIGERRLVAVRVGDTCQVVFGVVGVVRDMARRVGDVKSLDHESTVKSPTCHAA